jgi:hypothetical protein
MSRSLVALLLAAPLLSLPGRAGAQVFNPVQPATCPALTYVNWDFSISNNGWMAESDPNNGNNYANNIDYTVNIAANERVYQFWMRFDAFATEQNYDYLEVWSYSPNQAESTDYHYTGGMPYAGGQQPWAVMQGAWPIPKANDFLHFHSDYSVNNTGVYLGQAAVCTTNPGAPLQGYYRSSAPVTRNSGVLLGAGDVVYFQFPVGSPTGSCTSAHDTFALQGDPTAGNDFDLYVKCGALPTPNGFTDRDFSGPTTSPTGRPANSGFVHADTSECPCGSYWYVAVNSYSGSGWFNLVNHKHFASEHRNTLYTGTTFSASANDINTKYVPSLQAGLQHFFGANEGARYIQTMDFKNNSTDPDVQIHAGDSTPNSECENSWYCGFFGAYHCTSDLYQTFDGVSGYQPVVVSHELGHFINCLSDEYEDGIGTECGHSIMGSEWLTNNNYCYCNNQNNGNKCGLGYGDHGWDPSPANLTNMVTGTAWINLQGSSPVKITSTPDNYDFQDFDFHGRFANPVVHP